eukprot:CAMPEP_0180618134 /NCGR_PEP_ID=MMETSP1037_2-20121125/33411_1 /TAXON_ID=632150 /ORGANISM="Azadinium spinosum, Strain 3D9" /LENGTH=234 /DNA_ID=CAMNT_0022638139 /DNA_START=24 /DNA_END=726 /DNA_ORIENTATION=-
MGSCFAVEAARPPPEICGIWSTGPLAIKKAFPEAYAGRLKMGLPEAESDDDAYALLIVDEKGQCQYRNQGKAVVGGSYVSASSATTYKGPILDFSLDEGETWKGVGGFKFSILGKAYFEHDGVKLLTTLAVNGNKFNRLTSLTLGPPLNVSVLMTLGEADNLGVLPVIAEAIKTETERIAQMQAHDQQLNVSVPGKEGAAPGPEGESTLNGATIVRAHSGAVEAFDFGAMPYES